MENKNTPEPWRIGRLEHPRDYEVVRETVGPHEVVVDTDEGVYVLAGCNYNFPQDALANARRIVACVNACAGINTEALEHRVHLLKAEDDQIATLTKQRDELLSALERIAAGPGDNRLLTAIQWAKEAIGNVKGTNNV